MPVSREILEYVNKLIRSQSRRADYDKLYFGLQDLEIMLEDSYLERKSPRTRMENRGKPKRKLSAWNKFVKANSSKKIYKFANGKLKLKKMGIAFRKTPAGKKKK